MASQMASLSASAITYRTQSNLRSLRKNGGVQIQVSRSTRSMQVMASNRNVETSMEVTRRAALTSTLGGALLASSPMLLSPNVALADEASTTLYEDEIDKYAIQVPAEWETGLGGAQGAVGTRRVVAFYPAGNPETNVTVLVTNVAADFTKLGSFGTPYEFGTRLVGSLDRRRSGKVQSGPEPQACTLMDSGQANGMYNVEYTLAKPGEFNRHLLQVVALGNTGFYNRLYTVTAQAPEEDFAAMKPLLATVLASFKPPVAA